MTAVALVVTAVALVTADALLPALGRRVRALRAVLAAEVARLRHRWTELPRRPLD